MRNQDDTNISIKAKLILCLPYASAAMNYMHIYRKLDPNHNKKKTSRQKITHIYYYKQNRGVDSVAQVGWLT